MAAEIHRLIGDVLEKLENSHPDRRFLQGAEELFAGYLDQTALTADAALASPVDEQSPEQPITAPILDVPTRAHEIPIEQTAPGPRRPDPTGDGGHAPDQLEQASAPEQERVRLLGRLGAAPSFRRSQRGTLVGTFPLGIHHDNNGQDVTDWLTVLTFANRAEKLREAKLTRGQVAEVIGYKHLRQGRTKPGKLPKQVEEIYAVAVKAK